MNGGGPGSDGSSGHFAGDSMNDEMGRRLELEFGDRLKRIVAESEGCEPEHEESRPAGLLARLRSRALVAAAHQVDRAICLVAGHRSLGGRCIFCGTPLP